MQATAISNPPAANTPNAAPAGAPAILFHPQQSSPFTAVFQSVLKVVANSGKSPTPGKTQDSNRGSNNSTGPANYSPGLSLSGFAAPILPPNLAEASLPVIPLQQLVTSIAQTSDSPGKTAAPTIPFIPEQLAPDGGNSSQSNVAKLNVPGSISSLFQQVSAGLSSNPSGPGALPQQLGGTTTLATTNLNPQPIANSSLGANRNSVANSEPSPRKDTVAIPLPMALQDSAALQNVPDGAAMPQESSSGLTGAADPVGVNLPPAAEQAIPLPQVADSNAVTAKPVSTPAPTESMNKLFQNLAQQNIDAAAPQPGPPNVPAGGSNPPPDKAAQTAREDIKFLNMLTLIPASGAAKVPLAAAAGAPATQAAQSTLQMPGITSPALAETLVHVAAQPLAAGSPTLKVHEDLKSQPGNSLPAAPVAAVSAKAQSQEGSNGSAGNNSNSKPDHAPIAAAAQQAGKGFVQTIDAAAANTAGAHSSVTDPGLAAAVVSVATPSQAQATNPGPQPAAPAGADSRPAQFLPHSAEGAAVVNSAHILTQSGQTEIRIEMQADSLGGVELRAHIAGDQIGASISVEHHDAQVALTADLPALHSALAEKNLRVETLTVSQGTFSSLNGGMSQDAGQRGFAQQHTPTKFAYLEHPQTTQPYAETQAEWTGPARPGSGLSIVA